VIGTLLHGRNGANTRPFLLHYCAFKQTFLVPYVYSEPGTC
jgi:hypothetical protein